MTITLDIKELREFETKSQEWGMRRGLAAVEEITKIYSQQTLYGGMPSIVGSSIRKSLEEWDEKNPPPKLIPDA
jgi:hypothetical protein